MKTIALLNQKGGVGKSTTVVNLMDYFTRVGKRVLGIDIDSQGHLTKQCSINTSNENTILELLLEKATFDETVKKTRFGDVIPADGNLQLALSQFAQLPDFMYRVKEILEEQENKYDVVIFDCPPSINIVSSATLVASDYVIIPSEVEYFSLDGVVELANTIKRVQKRTNPTLKVLGILLVKYNPRRKLTLAFEEHLATKGKELFSADIIPVKIRYTVDIPVSQAQKQSIFEYKPKSAVAQEYKSLGDYIAGEIE